jgi:hypothetical protein
MGTAFMKSGLTGLWFQPRVLIVLEEFRGLIPSLILGSGKQP